MIRLIGILTGSALGIALLILAFGLPELPPQPDELPVEPVVQATEPPPAESLLTEPAATEPAATEPAETPLPATPETPPPEAVAEITPPAEVPFPEEPVAPPVEDPPLTAQPAQNWYAFWSPFRSRIAADGFVAELQRTTGLDYRVVKLKPGIYEVAFAYTDDADIQDKLDRISAATGMDMSGG